MSRNFSWFLRFIIYIPLAIAIFFMTSYSYLTSRFDSNFQTCSALIPISNNNRSPRAVADFVGCLKSKGNFFISRIMREERLYQYAQPKMQCQFIGKWHVSDLYKEYWITIDKDGRFFIEPMPYGRKDQAAVSEHRGLWSSTDKNTAIQFFDDEYFWPIKEYRVEWLSESHFALKNQLWDEQNHAIFFRSTPLSDQCELSVIGGTESHSMK